MELILSDDKTKELLAEGISEIILKRRDILQEIILEALKEVGHGNATAEGRKNELSAKKTYLTF